MSKTLGTPCSGPKNQSGGPAGAPLANQNNRLPDEEMGDLSEFSFQLPVFQLLILQAVSLLILVMKTL